MKENPGAAALGKGLKIDSAAVSNNPKAVFFTISELKEYNDTVTGLYRGKLAGTDIKQNRNICVFR